MAKYMHKSIEIDFNEVSGKFSATIQGKRVVGSSLDSMKKRIDKSETFQKFTALANRNRFNGPDYKTVTIVGIKQPRKGSVAWNSRPQWLDESGNEYGEVYTDTPETSAAIVAYNELQKQNRRDLDALKKAQDEAERAADAAITRVKFPA